MSDLALGHYRLRRRDNGATLTLTEMGVEGGALVRNRYGQSGLTVTVHREMSAPWALAPLKRYDLMMPTGETVLWSGWVTAPSKQATGGAQTHSYGLQGPGWWLERYTYQEQTPRQAAASLGSVEADLEMGQRASHIAGYDITGRVSLRGQITKILAYLVSQGAPIAYTTDGLPDLYQPESPNGAITCAAALDQQMGWVPEWSRRWQCSAGLPRLRFVEAGATRTLPLDGSGGVRVVSCSATERHDLLMPRFVLRFIGEAAPEGDLAVGEEGATVSLRRSWESYYEQVSEVDNGGFGETVVEIQGQPATRVRGRVILPGQQPPDEASGGAPTWAQYLHGPTATLHSDIDVEMEGVDWAWQPGDILHLTGLADIAAPGVIGQVSVDLATGRMRVVCSPPGARAVILAVGMQRPRYSIGTGEYPPSGGGVGGGGGGEADAAEEAEEDPTPAPGEFIQVHGVRDGVAGYYQVRTRDGLGTEIFKDLTPLT
jgi:hypothetical protein